MACMRQAARGAAAALSAVRHPQRADRRERDRGGGRRRGLRIPAPARHGRGALRGAAGGGSPARPAASMRRSAAIATCSPIWCGGCWRTAPTRRSSSVAADPTVPVDDDPEAPAGLDRRRRARAPSAHPAAARSLSAGAARIRRASSSATARASRRCSPRSRSASPRDAQAAPLIDGVARAGHDAPRALADRRQHGRAGDRGRRRRSAQAAMAAAQAGFAAWARDAGRASAPRRSNAPPICSKPSAAG